MSVSHILGQYKSNIDITELYSKRSTVFKFGLFAVNLSRSSGVFLTEPFKSQKKHCRVKKEHDGNRHASYRPWREAMAKTLKTCFSLTLILQPGIKIMIVNTVTSFSSCLILQTELYRHRVVQFIF